MSGHRTIRNNKIVFGHNVSMADIRPWNMTVASFRDAALEERVSALYVTEWSNQFMPDADTVHSISRAAHRAVKSGQLIDLGNLPNNVIKEAGLRGGPLYTQGAIGLPFSDPWVLFHTWEGGPTAYVVQLVKGQPNGGCIEIAELIGVEIKGLRLLIVGDHLHYTPTPQEPARYNIIPMPSYLRCIDYEMQNGPLDVTDNPEPLMAGVGPNLLDPLMAALLIMNTDGVPSTTIRATDKLQKARAKNGKPMIPPYRQVTSAGYVTALVTRRTEQQNGKRGTHASPVMHIRRGHNRHYKRSGETRWIKDMLINANEAARNDFIATRTHYKTGATNETQN